MEHLLVEAEDGFPCGHTRASMGNTGLPVLSMTSQLAEQCRMLVFCVREALYLPVITRRKGLLRREPHALLLHLQAVGDVPPHVRCVLSST